MFVKTAKADVLAHWEGQGGTLSRTAGLEKTASHFVQNAGRIDVTSALADVAAFYNISSNPQDYFFIPVRANSIDVPNENGDCFMNGEMLRFDPKLGRRVYQTYMLKPHHVNHRADNPLMARGFIVDVHYNNQNAMPDEWRKKYADATGVDHPQDLFIEALLAVDSTKDKHLAAGLKSGQIKAFSMGCECAMTECSVCGNQATNRMQFCAHIRTGNKNKLFFSEKLGRNIKAFERCYGVCFSELSAVDTPADPRAFASGEVFQLHASSQVDREELLQIVAFAKKHKDSMPKTLQGFLAEVLNDYAE
jgi:hypothetical protein